MPQQNNFVHIDEQCARAIFDSLFSKARLTRKDQPTFIVGNLFMEQMAVRYPNIFAEKVCKIRKKLNSKKPIYRNIKFGELKLQV